MNCNKKFKKNTKFVNDFGSSISSCLVLPDDWLVREKINNLQFKLYVNKKNTVVAALRGVAIQRGTRVARAGTLAAAAAFARHPSPLTTAAAATLHGYAATP